MSNNLIETTLAKVISVTQGSQTRPQMQCSIELTEIIDKFCPDDDPYLKQTMRKAMDSLAKVLVGRHDVRNFIDLMSWLSMALEIKESEKDRAKFMQENG